MLKKLMLLFCVSLFALGEPALAETAPARIVGGRAHVLPDWFKQSFLNIKDDAVSARQDGRHLLIFFDFNDCPYCARSLDENFRQGDNMVFIKKNFDVIALNMRGSQEVTWIDGVTSTEIELTKKLKIVGTPSMVFIDPESGKIVLRLNGYRAPSMLRHAVEFVHEKQYRNQSLADYIEKKVKASPYIFVINPHFKKMTNFTQYQKPLAVIFEDKNCADCKAFHEKVLNKPAVIAEFKPFQLVRLDAYADTPITDIAGKPSTPRRWAAALGLNYSPSIVLFDEGKEVARIGGLFYHFHFKEMLRFVSGKHYQRYPDFESYLAVRQKELLDSGTSININQ